MYTITDSLFSRLSKEDPDTTTTPTKVLKNVW